MLGDQLPDELPHGARRRGRTRPPAGRQPDRPGRQAGERQAADVGGGAPGSGHLAVGRGGGRGEHRRPVALLGQAGEGRQPDEPSLLRESSRTRPDRARPSTPQRPERIASGVTKLTARGGQTEALDLPAVASRPRRASDGAQPSFTIRGQGQRAVPALPPRPKSRVEEIPRPPGPEIENNASRTGRTSRATTAAIPGAAPARGERPRVRGEAGAVGLGAGR